MGMAGAQRYQSGSPPRSGGQRIVRFTPTCVGTTGEDSVLRVLLLGSPPRAWGQRSSTSIGLLLIAVHPHVRGDNAQARLRIAGEGRFTPTCVGTTLAVYTPGCVLT